MNQFLPYFNLVVYILVALLKLAGTLLLGVGLGRLILDICGKDQRPWQVQIAFSLGIITLLIAFLFYSPLGLGGLSIGMGIAMVGLGIPKTEKTEK